MALGDLFGQDYMPVQPNSVANNPLFSPEAMRNQRINGMLGTLEQMQQNAQAQAHPLDNLLKSLAGSQQPAGVPVATPPQTKAQPTYDLDSLVKQSSQLQAPTPSTFGETLSGIGDGISSMLKSTKDWGQRNAGTGGAYQQLVDSQVPAQVPDTGNDSDVIDAASAVANPPKQDSASAKPEEMAKQIAKNSVPSQVQQSSGKTQTTVSARKTTATTTQPTAVQAQPATNGKPQTGTVDQLDQQLDPAQPAAVQQPAKPADQEFKWSSLVTDPRFLQTIAAFGNALSSGQTYGQAAYTGMEKGIAVGKEQAALAAAAEEKAYKRQQDQIANRRENKKVNIDVYKAETDRLNSESTAKLNDAHSKAFLSGINLDNAQIAQIKANINKINAETAVVKAGGTSGLKDKDYVKMDTDLMSVMPAGSTQEEVVAYRNSLLSEPARRYLVPPPDVVTKMREYATKGLPAGEDQNEAIKFIQRNHMTYGYNY